MTAAMSSASLKPRAAMRRGSRVRTAVAMGKALVYQQRELGLEAAYQLAGQTMACNMMDAAAQEGARAFAEKRTPEWKR